MNYIKNFVDRITTAESKQVTNFVMPLSDARGLRDEVVKLLADLHTLAEVDKNQITNIMIKGGTFK